MGSSTIKQPNVYCEMWVMWPTCEYFSLLHVTLLWLVSPVCTSSPQSHTHTKAKGISSVRAFRVFLHLHRSLYGVSLSPLVDGRRCLRLLSILEWYISFSRTFLFNSLTTERSDVSRWLLMLCLLQPVDYNLISSILRAFLSGLVI